MGVKASQPLEKKCEGELYIPKGKIVTFKEVQYLKYQSLQRRCEIHEVNSPDSFLLAQAYNELGEHFVTEGYVEASLEEFLKSLVILSQIEQDSLYIATVMFNVSKVYIVQKLYTHALNQLRKSLDIRLKINPISVAVAQSYTALAYVAQKLEQADKTVEYAKLATEVENTLHKEVVEDSTDKCKEKTLSLALYYQECGDHLHQEYVQRTKEFDALKSAELKNLLFDATLKYETALSLLTDKIESERAQANVYHALGIAYAAQGSYVEAVRNYRSALDLYESLSSNDSTTEGTVSGSDDARYDHTVVMVKIAEVHKHMGDNVQFLKASEISSGSSSSAGGVAAAATVFNVQTTVNPIKAARASKLKNEAKKNDKPEDPNASLVVSLQHYKQSEQIVDLFNPSSVMAAKLYTAISSLHYKQKNLSLSAEYLKKTLTILEKEQPRSLDLAEAHTALGRTLMEAGGESSSEALLQYQMAAELFEVLVPDSHAVASTYVSIGLVYQDQGYPSTALVEYQKALAIETALCPESADVKKVQELIGSLAKRPHVVVSYL